MRATPPSLRQHREKNKHETKKKTWEEAGNNKVREQMLLNIICPSLSPRGMVVRSNMAT